jgi:hypothetical protein
MRITIDKHGNTWESRRASAAPRPSRLWVIHPADFREVSRLDARNEFGYHLEIANDHRNRITRVVSSDVGEMASVLSDEEFLEYLDDIEEHEDWSDEKIREHMSERLHLMSESELRAMGGNPEVFDAMERAWQAINEFVAFGTTL